MALEELKRDIEAFSSKAVLSQGASLEELKRDIEAQKSKPILRDETV